MTLPRKNARERKLIKVTAWVPERQLRRLVKVSPYTQNQSALLRQLIEDELERIDAMKAHVALYGIARKVTDFDDRLL